MYPYSVASIKISNVYKLKISTTVSSIPKNPMQGIRVADPLCAFPTVSVHMCFLPGSILGLLFPCILYSSYAHMLARTTVFPV